ncbi:MAG: hypothetical protein ACKO6N_01840 [Myxococcota bacterium]
MLARVRPFLPYLLSLLPILWLLFPLFVRGQFYISEDGHTMLVEYPLYHLLGYSMEEGVVPLWTHKLGVGQPLMATGEVGAMHPLNLILFRYLPPYLAWQVAQVLALITNLVCANLLLRARQHTPLSSLLGAMTFAAGGVAVGQLRSLVDAQALAMLPLALMFALRYLSYKRANDAALTGVPIALAVVSGSFMTAGAIILALLLAVLEQFLTRPTVQPHVWERASILEPRWKRHLREGLLLPLAVGMAALLAAPQLLLTWEYLPFSTQAEGASSAYSALGVFGKSGWIRLIAPHALGIPVLGTWQQPERFGDTFLYVGLLPLVLCLTAPFLAWQGEKRMRLPLLLLGVGLLLSSGGPPLETLSQLFPPLRWWPYPGGFLMLPQLALAMLTAPSLDFLWERLEQHPHPLGRRFAGALPWLCMWVTALDLGYHGSSLLAWTDRTTLFRSLPSEAAIPNLGSYRLLSLPGGVTRTPSPPLRDDPQPFMERRAVVWRNYNLVARENALGAQLQRPLASVRADEQQLMQLLQPQGGQVQVSDAAFRWMHFLGVRMVLSYLPVRHPKLISYKTVPVPGLEPSVKLYGINEMMPRAYLVRGARACTPETMTRRIEAGHFGPGWKPCLLAHEDDPTPDETAAVVGVLEPVGRSELALKVKVNLATTALLVVRDAYAPGWVAELNGKETPILAVDGIWKAVALPEGPSELSLEYRPTAMRAGLMVNVLGILLLGFTFVLPYLPSRNYQLVDEDPPLPPEGERWYQ